MTPTIVCPICKQPVAVQDAKAHVRTHAEQAAGKAAPPGARAAAPGRAPAAPPPEVGNFPACFYCGALFATWRNVNDHIANASCPIVAAARAQEEAAEPVVDATVEG